MNKYDNINTFEEIVEIEHVPIVIQKRTEFEEQSQLFIISEMLKEARREADLTQ